jgi:hypothetical protein
MSTHGRPLTPPNDPALIEPNAIVASAPSGIGLTGLPRNTRQRTDVLHTTQKPGTRSATTSGTRAQETQERRQTRSACARSRSAPLRALQPTNSCTPPPLVHVRLSGMMWVVLHAPAGAAHMCRYGRVEARWESSVGTIQASNAKVGPDAWRGANLQTSPSGFCWDSVEGMSYSGCRQHQGCPHADLRPASRPVRRTAISRPGRQGTRYQAQ